MKCFNVFQLPRSRTSRALLITALYSTLVFLALYAPIGPQAPFVLLFGTKALAREAIVACVQPLFWPVVALIGFTIVEPWLAPAKPKLQK